MTERDRLFGLQISINHKGIDRYRNGNGKRKNIPLDTVLGKEYSLNIDSSFDLLRFYASCNYNPNFHNNGQNHRHLSVMTFITANWMDLLNDLTPDNERADFTNNVFCYPEVVFPDPRNNNKFFAVDCLGSDEEGKIYVVEIGTRGKNKQLQGEINALKKLYPDLKFIGILAYYKFNRRRTNGKIDFTILNSFF